MRDGEDELVAWLRGRGRHSFLFAATVDARYNGIRHNGNLAIAEIIRRFHLNHIQITESLAIII